MEVSHRQAVDLLIVEGVKLKDALLLGLQVFGPNAQGAVEVRACELELIEI